MRVPTLLLLALTLAVVALAQDGLSVSSEPAADGKTLVSARSGAWGAPPLGPGTVTFTAGSNGPSATGDVHLGLAQAVLALACGAPTGVTAVFTPSGGGSGAKGETMVTRPC